MARTKRGKQGTKEYIEGTVEINEENRGTLKE
jgi:hypothetical protein